MTAPDRRNRQVHLVARPSGVAQAEHFALVDVPLPRLRPGEMRIANRYLSVEPAMRGWIADVDNYAALVPLHSAMRAITVGEVIESLHPDYHEGEILTGWFGWQEIATVTADAVIRRVTEHDLPITLSLGVLGINGVTALLALTKVGEPRSGDTVLVSSGAGSVGSAVGQIAKLMGCRTVAIAGGGDKCGQCRDLFGFDAAIDYHREDVAKAVEEACPDGVNVYFDNVGGAISDAVHPRLAPYARVVVCGTASQRSWDPWPSGPRLERMLLVKRARMQGFVVFDHEADYASAIDRLASWVRDGRLRYSEDILDGLEQCPDALAGIYRGDNRGKRLIRV